MTAQHNDTAGGTQDSVLLFCLRAESDVDHVVPVIDALARRGSHAIRVIVYDPIKTYRDDYRVRHLQQRYGLKVEHLLELPGLGLGQRLTGQLLRGLFHGLLALQRRTQSNYLQRALRPALLALQRRLRTLGESDPALAALTAEVGKLPSGLVALDHTIAPFAAAVTAAAHDAGLTTLALPHSVPHLSDLAGDPAFGGRDKDRTVWSRYYDRVVLPNAPTAARFSADCKDPDLLRVLGSARFSRGWGETLDEIAPRFDWNPGGTKVLFILSKKGPYVDWAEVNRVSELLCRDPRIAVAFKPHPRTEISGLPSIEGGRQVTVASADMPTVSMIRWADLVVFWGSSVIYDALRQEKPVLHLAYLFRLHFDFEPYLPSWRVGSFKEFRERLEAFLTAGTPTYDAAEARACMAALVEPEGKPVLERYADLIEAQLAAPRPRTPGETPADPQATAVQPGT